MDGVAEPDGSDEDEEYDRLPAGNEKEWQKQCYFCGVVGSKRKNSKRGKKGVQFVRRLRTQRENPDECAAGRPSTGMPSKKYFPPDAAGRPRSLLPREEQARQAYPVADTPHWACASKRQGHASCAHSNQNLSWLWTGPGWRLRHPRRTQSPQRRGPARNQDSRPR